MVKLYENGKPRADIARVYEIIPSALDRWIKNHQEIGFFKAEDNRPAEGKELLDLREEVQCLRKENDILKQAALIMGRK